MRMMLGVGLYLVPLGMIVIELIELAEAPLRPVGMVKIGAGLGAISFGIISRDIYGYVLD